MIRRPVAAVDAVPDLTGGADSIELALECWRTPERA
jgi:hypothetical protein